MIPERKKERKTSTEIVGAEKGTWKQEITLLKGLNPTDIKEFLSKSTIFTSYVIYDILFRRLYVVEDSFVFVQGFEYFTTKCRSRNGPMSSLAGPSASDNSRTF